MSSQIMDSIKRELQQYWRLLPRWTVSIAVYFSVVFTLVSSLIALYSLVTPVVIYDGLVLRGYISPLTYHLLVENRVVSYPHLDSVNTIGWITLLYNVLVIALAVYSLFNYRQKPRSSIVLLAVSNATAYLLLGVVYSVIRVLSADIVPTLPYTIYAEVYGGRIVLEPPQAYYTWSYYLPWQPLLFVVLSVVLMVLAGILLLILALTPRPPVSRVRRISKKVVTPKQ